MMSKENEPSPELMRKIIGYLRGDPLPLSEGAGEMTKDQLSEDDLEFLAKFMGWKWLEPEVNSTVTEAYWDGMQGSGFDIFIYDAAGDYFSTAEGREAVRKLAGEKYYLVFTKDPRPVLKVEESFDFLALVQALRQAEGRE